MVALSSRTALPYIFGSTSERTISLTLAMHRYPNGKVLGRAARAAHVIYYLRNSFPNSRPKRHITLTRCVLVSYFLSPSSLFLPRDTVHHMPQA